MKIEKEAIDYLKFGESYWKEIDYKEVEVYRLINSIITDYDLEKGYVRKDLVVLDVSSNKYYFANVLVSYYHRNDPDWIEVFPYTETITKYK